jgi:hypothetical protein
MDPKELHRPWLATMSVSALLSPIGVRIMDIDNWVRRDFVEFVLVGAPGKRHARLFSLYSAVILHGINLGVRQGLNLTMARKLGQVCGIRLEQLNNPRDTGYQSLIWPTDEEVFSCWIEQEALKGAFITPQELANEILRTGFPTPSVAGMTFDIDGLLTTIWSNYHDIDVELNQKALEGRLKPFPKHLLKGANVDESPIVTTPEHLERPDESPVGRRRRRFERRATAAI